MGSGKIMWYRVIISRPQGPAKCFCTSVSRCQWRAFQGEREVLCTYINIYVLISQANKLSIVGTQVVLCTHFFPSKRRSALRGANTEAHKNGDHWRHCKWQLPRSCHGVLFRKQKSLWINKRLPMTDDSFSIGAQNFKPLRSRIEPVTVQFPSMPCSKMILVKQNWYSLVRCKPSRPDIHLKINLSILTICFWCKWNEATETSTGCAPGVCSMFFLKYNCRTCTDARYYSSLQSEKVICLNTLTPEEVSEIYKLKVIKQNGQQQKK